MTMGHDCKQMPDLGNVLHGVDPGVIGATGPNRPRRENFGIRGDVRYFRSVQDSDAGEDIDFDFGSFDFWRATFGVTFRF